MPAHNHGFVGATGLLTVGAAPFLVGHVTAAACTPHSRHTKNNALSRFLVVPHSKTKRRGVHQQPKKRATTCPLNDELEILIHGMDRAPAVKCTQSTGYGVMCACVSQECRHLPILAGSPQTSSTYSEHKAHDAAPNHPHFHGDVE